MFDTLIARHETRVTNIMNPRNVKSLKGYLTNG